MKKEKYQTLFLRIQYFLGEFKTNLENCLTGIEKENHEQAMEWIKKENELQADIIQKTKELEEMKSKLVREQ